MSEWPLPSLPSRWSGAQLPPFVGREREFAALEQVWAAVERGARQVVFVGGEAGAGKSRLASEAATLLHRHGVSVLVGACRSDLGSEYDPFVEPVAALRPAIESGSLALTGGGLDTGASVELLRLMTGGVPGEGAPQGWRGTPRSAPAMFSAVTSALLSAAAVRPLLLLLEDLHWAGETALRLLRFAVERTADAPILVLGTMRTSPPDRSTQLSLMVSDLMRIDGVSRVDLAGLDTAQIADYLVRSGPVSVTAARRVASILRDKTGGNPFLLREVCRDLGVRGAVDALDEGDLPAPESVRMTILGRLDAMEPADRAVVEAAAVIGEEFGVALLAALAPAREGKETAAAVFAALEAARNLGLVDWTSEGGGSGRFRHALARQAVLDGMSVYRLARVNADVAVALERLPAAELRVRRLAHHYAKASVLGYDDKAAHYLAAAAGAARARLAHADAAALYERAVHHTADPARRDELRLAAARAHLQSTKGDRARELAELVATTAADSLRVRAATLYEAASWQSAVFTDRSIHLLASALRDAAHVSDEERALATAALGRACALGGLAEEADAYVHDALRRAREIGTPDLLASVLSTCLHYRNGLDGLHERLDQAKELTELVSGTGDLAELGPAAFFRCVIHYTLGDPDELDAAHRDLARVARATNEPYWRFTLGNVTSGRELVRCEFDAASATLQEIARIGAMFDGGKGATEGAWSLQSYMLRRETGRLAGIRHLITGDEDAAVHWAPGLLALYTELGLPDAARRVLTSMVEGGLDGYQRSASWPVVLSFLVDAAVRLEDRAAARELYPRAARFAGLNLVASEFLAALGSGDRLIGSLESVLGISSAGRRFDAALDMDARMGSPLHRATTLAEHVAHLRRTGEDPGRAKQLAAEAAALCDRYGLARVRRLLAPAAAPEAPRGNGVLTPREIEVLDLLGQGMSNREIARSLVISEYTAANHVRNILAKIRCTNRTQAAMYAVALRTSGDRSQLERDHGPVRKDPVGDLRDDIGRKPGPDRRAPDRVR